MEKLEATTGISDTAILDIEPPTEYANAPPRYAHAASKSAKPQCLIRRGRWSSKAYIEVDGVER